MVRLLVSRLVSYPKDIKIEQNESASSKRYIITISANLADQPKLIGSSASNIRALEEIVKRAAEVQGSKASLILLTPHTGKEEGRNKYKDNKSWGDADENSFLDDVQSVVFSVCRGDIVVGSLTKKGEEKSVITAESVVAGGDEDISESLHASLRIIFHAWGRAAGRNINFYFIK